MDQELTADLNFLTCLCQCARSCVFCVQVGILVIKATTSSINRTEHRRNGLKEFSVATNGRCGAVVSAPDS